MIKSDNSIQFKIKFTFTVYEYIIVYEFILLSNLMYIYIYIYINIKEALALLFSCEFYKISKNTFSYRATPMAASDVSE